ncbi:MAG TPA: methylmalonyl-CoA epimerase [Bacteroidales bacterium]|nr:methylmalonyl-CoA epimerase [Bacteroidales bacterium]HPI68616.1 methylmalonyl-CoA epimerase [Bacteroidales bacterium]HPR73161.1 methylmalonyl-CoA epimerase [Bacteroidales bacterium]
MKLSYIEHIGIAVKDLPSSVEMYEKIFGLKCYKTEEIASQKVIMAFFRIGTTRIELLASTDPDSSLAKFIEKKGEGVHHIAFAVNELEKQLDDARAQGIRLVNEKPEKGAEGMDIAFIHPRSASGVLIELCEDKSINC